MRSTEKIVVSALCLTLLFFSACTPKGPAVEEKFQNEDYKLSDVSDSTLAIYGIEKEDLKDGLVADKGDEVFTDRAIVVWFKDSAKAKEVYNRLKKEEGPRVLRKGDMVALGNREALDVI